MFLEKIFVISLGPRFHITCLTYCKVILQTDNSTIHLYSIRTLVNLTQLMIDKGNFGVIRISLKFLFLHISP